MSSIKYFDLSKINNTSKIFIVSNDKKEYRGLIKQLLNKIDIKKFNKKYLISVSDRPSKLSLDKREWTLYKYFDKRYIDDNNNCIVITNLPITSNEIEIISDDGFGIVQSSYPKNIMEHFNYIFIGKQDLGFIKKKIYRNYIKKIISEYNIFLKLLDNKNINFIIVNVDNLSLYFI
jgi:hypothetical protein